LSYYHIIQDIHIPFYNLPTFRGKIPVRGRLSIRLKQPYSGRHRGRMRVFGGLLMAMPTVLLLSQLLVLEAIVLLDALTPVVLCYSFSSVIKDESTKNGI
jgi:hypothetical protein